MPSTAAERSAAEELERSARFWMRAYPRRWRTAFGDDLVGIVADVSDPDADRVSVREAVAVVKGGWALRLREHPPLLRWLAYRLMDIRLPLKYAHWVADDILGAFFVARKNVIILVWLPVWAAYLSGTWDWNQALPFLWMYVALVVVVPLPFMRPVWLSRRRSAWQKHVSPEVPWGLLATRDKAFTPRAVHSTGGERTDEPGGPAQQTGTAG